MSAIVVTSAVTVTANQSVVIVTTTIGADDPIATGTGSNSGVDSGSGVTSPTAAPTIPPSNTDTGSDSSRSTLVPALVGGILGGVVLVALIIFLACLMKRRSRSRKQPSPFADDASEKNRTVIAGLPPKPSRNSGLHGASSHHPSSISGFSLLASDRSFPRGESAYAFSKWPSTGSLAPSGHTYIHSPPQYHATPNRYSHISGGHSPNASTYEHPESWSAHAHDAGRPQEPYWSPPRSNAVPAPSPYGNPRGNVPSLPLGAAAPNYAAAHENARSDIGSAPVDQAHSSSPPSSSQASYTPQPVQSAFGPSPRASAGVARTSNLSPIPGSVSEHPYTEHSHGYEPSVPRLPSISMSSPLVLQNSTMSHSGDTSQRRGSGSTQPRANLADQSSNTYNDEYWIKSPKAEEQRADEQGDTSASLSGRNASGSRMVEMLDTVDEPAETESPPAEERTTRPPFWRDRSVSSQSIRKIFRGSPRTSADQRN